MSNNNNSRRGFLQKLGLGVGILSLFGSESMAETKGNSISLQEDRREFLVEYENWVNEYIDVVEKEKNSVSNMDNKKQIMRLSEQADGWQNQIKEYIKHEDFKEKYISLSKKFASSITPELEA